MKKNKKRRNSEKSDKDFAAGIKKKSFELQFNGGSIWCEHLDGMGNHEQEVISKFEGE